MSELRFFVKGPSWTAPHDGAAGLSAWLERTSVLTRIKTGFSIIGYDSKGHRPDPPRLVDWGIGQQVYFLGTVTGPERHGYVFAIRDTSTDQYLFRAADELVRNGFLVEWFLVDQETEVSPGKVTSSQAMLVT